MRRIGRYKVRGRLGKGGMCTIYKVAMPVTEKIVALKLLTPPEILLDMVGEERLRKLFRDEAVTMAHLRHPHIADVWDYDEHEGRPFFVMEYFCNNVGLMLGEGEEPEKPSRTFSPDKLFHYGRQLLEGLSCLHQAGIIHRDIKPGNLLVTDQDTIKIADFGLSKKHDEHISVPEQIKIGSFHYAAPEQHADPEGVDGRADLYSAGVTLYRMLKGTLPDRNSELADYDPENPNTILYPFFEKVLAENPGERYQSAEEMLAELRRLERTWLQEKNDYCRIIGPTVEEPEREEQSASLRTAATRVALVRARNYFGLDRFWRPLKYCRNEFLENRNETVTDQASGLIWQQSGSNHPLTWEGGCEYIESLNKASWAGISDWRLPTVAELLSLLNEQDGVTGMCVEAVFDQSKRSLWSSDRRSITAAWYVNLDMGFVHWLDYKCYVSVRAVSTC